MVEKAELKAYCVLAYIHVCRCVCDYLEERGEADTDYLFVGQRGRLTAKGVAYNDYCKT